jgi:exodeoxyribonuclease VII large subunit
VIRDIMHRLNERFPRRVLLWPVQVQGDWAATEVSAAIRGFNALGPGSRLPRPDLLIVARGGGSLEDLMPFNDEVVVRAVAASTIPLISAVGHETDTTLIDLVSDRRAPTPTAAAEMAVPVRTDLLAQSLDLQRRALRGFARGVAERRRHLDQLARALPRADQLFVAARQRLDLASERLGHAVQRNLQKHREQLLEATSQLRPRQLSERISVCGDRTRTLGRRLVQAERVKLVQIRRNLDATGRVLDSVSYRSVLARGFVLVRGEDGKVRRRAADLEAGENLTLDFADGPAEATAKGGTEPAPAKARPAARSGKVPGTQGSLF